MKAVFLDRDGVICRVEKGKYVCKPEDLEILPTAAPAIIRLKQLGYLVIVVTNQLGISLGYATMEDVENVHKKMKEELGRSGAEIDDIFLCPNMSSLRKPALGMFIEAVRKWDIDIEASYLIGDSLSDMLAAENLGCEKILVKSCMGPRIAEDILQAVEIIEKTKKKEIEQKKI